MKFKYSIIIILIHIFLELKECKEYAKNILTTETLQNVHGQVVTIETDNCGHVHRELILGGLPAVSGKTLYFNQCSFTNDILTG